MRQLCFQRSGALALHHLPEKVQTLLDLGQSIRALGHRILELNGGLELIVLRFHEPEYFLERRVALAPTADALG